MRASLALVCSLCEAKLYDLVKDKVNYRVARYMLAMLVTSAGMWNASTGWFLDKTTYVAHLFPAFLPSSFAMYFVALAFAYSLEPASLIKPRRTLQATLLYATAAIVGWPFALALALPFVFEELFLFAGDIVPSQDKQKWQVSRWLRLLKSGAVAALIFVSVVTVLLTYH